MTFVILLTRAILSFDLNLLIPISKVSKKPWTGGGGRGEDTVTCQLENLILSRRVSVRAFPGRCGATLGWTLTPQRAHPPTLLPPPEPRGINAEEKFLSKNCTSSVFSGSVNSIFFCYYFIKTALGIFVHN